MCICVSLHKLNDLGGLYPGIELASLTSPALAGGFFTTSATWDAQVVMGTAKLGDFITKRNALDRCWETATSIAIGLRRLIIS